MGSHAQPTSARSALGLDALPIASTEMSPLLTKFRHCSRVFMLLCCQSVVGINLAYFAFSDQIGMAEVHQSS